MRPDHSISIVAKSLEINNCMPITARSVSTRLSIDPKNHWFFSSSWLTRQENQGLCSAIRHLRKPPCDSVIEHHTAVQGIV